MYLDFFDSWKRGKVRPKKKKPKQERIELSTGWAGMSEYIKQCQTTEKRM